MLLFWCPLKLQATDGMDNLEQLINLNDGEGQIYTMEGPLCLKSVQSMFGWVMLSLCVKTTKYVLVFLSAHCCLGNILWWTASLCFCVVRKLIDQAYSPFHAVLRCGNLTSDVQVFPRPEPVIIDEEVDPLPKTVQTGASRESNEMFVF